MTVPLKGGKVPDLNTNGKYAPPSEPVTNRVEPVLNALQFQQLLDMTHNEVRSRDQWLSRFLDPRRDLEQECGFPALDATIPPRLYKDLYERDAVSARVVECLPKEACLNQPSVFEDDDEEVVTPFEQAWDDLGKNLAGSGGQYRDEKGSVVWNYLLRGLVASRIGSFGILLLGFDDELPLDQPIELKDIRSKVSFQKVQDPMDGKDKVAGVKVDIEDKGPIRPDGMTTDKEEEAVKNGSSVGRWNWTTNSCDVTAVPLSSYEKQVVNRWTRNRLGYQQYVENIKLKKKVNPAQMFGQTGIDDSNPNSLSYAAWMALGSTAGTSDLRPNSSMVPRSPLEAIADQGKQFGSGSVGQGDEGLDDPPGMEPDPSNPFAPSEDGNETEDDPLGEDGQPTTTRKLLYIRPYDESQVQIVRYEWDASSPRFGHPVMYRVTLNDARDQYTGIGLPLNTVMVHWTRCIHLADDRLSSDVFGKPAMRKPLNNLLGLRKILLADPEAYWKGAFHTISIETPPQTGGDVNINVPAVRSMMEQAMNSSQRWWILRGLQAKPIAPTVVDPTPHIDAQIKVICMLIGIPVPVFCGYEIGEQASENNDSTWDDRKKAYMWYHVVSDVVVPFVDRLIAAGCLPIPATGYGVDVPDPDATSGKDQSAIALSNMQTVAAWVTAGGEAALPLKTLYTSDKFLNMDKEEADVITEEVERAQEEQLAQQAMMAEEHGFTPDPTDPTGKTMLDPEQQDMENEIELAKAKNPAGVQQGGGAPFGGKGGPPGKGPPGAKPGGPPGNPFAKKGPPVGNEETSSEVDLVPLVSVVDEVRNVCFQELGGIS